MNSRAPSRRGAAPAARPQLASGIAARPKSGLLRRIGRIGSQRVVALIRGPQAEIPQGLWQNVAETLSTTNKRRMP